MKRLFGAILLVCGCAWAASAAEIGAAAPELDLGPMLKGEKFRLADRRGKVVVLHFWKTRCPPCAAAVPQINELIAKYDGKVQFLAVGVEFPDRLRQENHWREFKCPVVSDSFLRTSEQYLIRQSRFPADAVIGADGKLLWQGPTALLAGALGEIMAGKYDLAAAAALDRFNREMVDAMAKKDHERALKILRARRKLFPDDLELAVGEANILAGSCGRSEEALAVLDRAIAGHPKAFNLHCAKLRVLCSVERDNGERLRTCEAIAREFADRPALLTSLATGMMKQPAGTFDLAGVWILAHTAYRSTARKAPVEQGRAASALARCYYYMGLTDRAVLYQTEALRELRKTREAGRAASDLAFYREAVNAAEKVRELEAEAVRK